MSKVQTHTDFAKTNNEFRRACEAAGIEPTTRQAGKYRRGKGLAYKQKLKLRNT